MKRRIDLNTPLSLEIYDNGNRAQVKARILRTGKFTSGVTGQTFNITIQDLINVKNHYNGKIKEYIKSMFHKDKTINYDLQDVQMAPTCVEHKVEDEYIVGRVIGSLWLEDDAETQTTWVWATLEILGIDNVEKVRDGRRKAVSINFNTETYELQEVSFVAYGAIDDACIMSGTNTNVNASTAAFSDNTQLLELMNKIDKIDKIMDHRYLSISKLQKEINNIDKQITFTKKVQSLVKSCRLTKADMKRIISTVDNASEETLQTVLAVLSKLPKYVDTRKHKYNVDDFLFREYLMDKKDLTTDEVLAELNKAMLKSSAQFKGGIEQKVEISESHTHGDEHEIKLKHEDVEHLKNFLKDGKHENAYAYLCEMTADMPESEKKVEEIDSKETEKMEQEKKAKHAEMKENEDSLDKERKEKAELKAKLDETTAQLSALTTALNQVINK